MVYGRVLGALALEVFDVNFLVRHLDPEDGWKPGQAIHNASNIKENSGMKIGTSGDNGDAGMRGMGESSCFGAEVIRNPNIRNIRELSCRKSRGRVRCT